MEVRAASVRTVSPFLLFVFVLNQLVQRINSIYNAKRGKKRLKKLSMSSLETSSLRGRH